VVQQKEISDLKLLIDSRVTSFNERLQSLLDGVVLTDEIKTLITGFNDLGKTEIT
jgi:hypothetical protein